MSMVPYRRPGDLEELPQSPLAGWKVIRMEPVHRTGTRLGALSMMRITLHYEHADGEYVACDVMVDKKERLLDLIPFLLASQDLPSGIRIELARTKRAPYQAPR